MKKWIQKLDLKKGALRAQAEKAGKIRSGKIDKSWLKSKASGSGKTAKRARLAIAFSHMKP